jgi:RHS repeat-associated protein
MHQITPHTKPPPNSKAAAYGYGAFDYQKVGYNAAELSTSTNSPLYSWGAGNKSGQWEANGEEAFLFLEFFGSFCFKTKTNKDNRYFYHGDHLGSSSWITDGAGDVNQYLAYMPFGEQFIDQRGSTGHDIRFKFTGKERDSKTGYTYFGARYYDSWLSVWLSVDPLSDKYPSMSPFMYTAGNPVMLVDPDGRWVKGAGFWRNITKTDNRINAENRAAALGGDAKAYRNEEGKGWSVSYSSNESWPTDLGNGGTLLSSETVENYSNSSTFKDIKRRGNDGRKWINENKTTIVNISHVTQNIGDGVVFIGYICTVSVIGAEIGVPLAALGNTISGIGTGIEVAVELNSNDFGEASKDVGFEVAGILVNKGLNKIIPGSGSLITKKGKDIGKEILTQGGQLKVIGLEKVVDAATEKSKQNKN